MAYFNCGCFIKNHNPIGISQQWKQTSRDGAPKRAGDAAQPQYSPSPIPSPRKSHAGRDASEILPRKPSEVQAVSHWKHVPSG